MVLDDNDDEYKNNKNIDSKNSDNEDDDIALNDKNKPKQLKKKFNQNKYTKYNYFCKY